MATCRKCGALIQFRLTRNEKQQPINLDGVPHQATCAAIPHKKKPSAHTPKQTPPLIDNFEGCPNDCASGWILIQDPATGRSGVRPCSIHRKKNREEASMSNENAYCGPVPLTPEQQTEELARLGFADYAEAQRPRVIEIRSEFLKGNISARQMTSAVVAIMDFEDGLISLPALTAQMNAIGGWHA